MIRSHTTNIGVAMREFINRNVYRLANVLVPINTTVLFVALVSLLISVTNLVYVLPRNRVIGIVIALWTVIASTPALLQFLIGGRSENSAGMKLRKWIIRRVERES